jgi:hypothetical protein
MASITRRQLLACLVIVGLIGLVVIYWPIGWRRAVHDRIRRRSEWLNRTETELRTLVRQPPPEGKALDSPPWKRYDVLRFQNSWAAGCVHNAHMDDDPTSLESGIGDLIVLVDSQGRAVYSLQHLCVGRLLGSHGDEHIEDLMRFREAADLNGYMNAYSDAPVRNRPWWRANRSDVLDDSTVRRLAWFPLWELGGLTAIVATGYSAWSLSRRRRAANSSTSV